MSDARRGKILKIRKNPINIGFKGCLGIPLNVRHPGFADRAITAGRGCETKNLGVEAIPTGRTRTPPTVRRKKRGCFSRCWGGKKSSLKASGKKAVFFEEPKGNGRSAVRNLCGGHARLWLRFSAGTAAKRKKHREKTDHLLLEAENRDFLS